jgi:N-acyl-L-homoserine lactone synthetase
MRTFDDDGLGGRCTLTMAGEAERREIYAIRHEVYARELHQHAENERGELNDPLDAHNLYIVAKRHERVVGFVSVTPPPGPYSLDKYLPRAQ